MRNELLTNATILHYTSNVKVIIRNLRAAGRDPLPYNITEDDARYLISEKWIKLTVKTRKGYWHSLRRYTEFFDNQTIKKIKVRFPHDMRPNVDWLTDHQVKQILTYPMDQIQKFVIYCELYGGLRRRDVMGLTVNSILPKHLHVLGKGAIGGKPRLVPYGDEFAAVIEEFLLYRNKLIEKAKNRRPTAKVPNELLIYEKGGKLSAYDEFADAIDKRVCRKMSKELGFKFSNHTLRRTLARRLYRMGVKLRTIADILGQEDSADAERYIGLINDDMVAAIENLTF